MMSVAPSKLVRVRDLELNRCGVLIRHADGRQGDVYPLLQSKGFARGVPLNTETAAVNPRAGVA